VWCVSGWDVCPAFGAVLCCLLLALVSRVSCQLVKCSSGDEAISDRSGEGELLGVAFTRTVARFIARASGTN
jgi:hypothetical protein